MGRGKENPLVTSGRVITALAIAGAYAGSACSTRVDATQTEVPPTPSHTFTPEPTPTATPTRTITPTPTITAFPTDTPRATLSPQENDLIRKVEQLREGDELPLKT